MRQAHETARFQQWVTVEMKYMCDNLPETVCISEGEALIAAVASANMRYVNVTVPRALICINGR